MKETKQKIIAKLKERLEGLSYVYALWLEGADANGTADEYSDMDIWADIADEKEADAIIATESALLEIAEFDYKYVKNHDHPQIRQRTYHLAGTCEYLMIDFCWQLHSRPKDEYVFFENNEIEAVKVIFDKEHIIRFKPLDVSTFTQQNLQHLEEAKYRMAQYLRVEKYIHRKQYLEALDKYNCYILGSLIDLLRLIYTPAHAHYYLTHISRHIPESERVDLEYFTRIKSLEDIVEKIPQAKKWFDELVVRLDNKH
jgi:predicted nucleotidyltransferase